MGTAEDRKPNKAGPHVTFFNLIACQLLTQFLISINTYFNSFNFSDCLLLVLEERIL